ncbi:MAG: AI-2E family transporter [bacterium]|nr:AI-2E family transporter [bacterium]
MFRKENVTPVVISTGTLVRAILLVLGVFAIWFLRDLVLILLTAIVISSFIESSVPYFKRVGIGRVLGIVMLYVTSILLLAGLFYLFAPLLITEIYNFSNFLSSYFPGVSFLDYFKDEAFSGAKDVVAGLSKDFSLASLASVSKAFIENLSGGFIKTLSVAFGSIFNFMLIILISFYLSVQENGIENFLRIILPIEHEEYVVDLWKRSRRKIALWFKGQLLLGLIITVLTYLVLSLLGIKYALLLSIIAGVMELVPYGILVALIPAASFSYLSGGISSALLVTGAYIIIHQFEVFLFAPLVIKGVVGLSPIVIILAALVGFELGGFWGVLLSIPLTVFVIEFTNDIEKRKISSKIGHESR